jgi:tRNA (cmo5U34)-methyltransferase
VSDELSQDRVFAKSLSEVKAFEFDETVARVFQDMISRSVPGYGLLLHMIGLYANIFVQAHSRVYDLGCSLGAASRIIAGQTSEIEPEIIALDNSESMILKCREHRQNQANIEWRCEDIQNTRIDNASMVVLNLTLQFLDPADRGNMLEKILRGLNPGGVLILSEKVIFDLPAENERMVELYHAFKKTRGYSDLEISQKRSALENVLIPDSDRLHQQRLQDIGFAEVYQCFRCFNFISYLAIKS